MSTGAWIFIIVVTVLLSPVWVPVAGALLVAIVGFLAIAVCLPFMLIWK